MAESLHAKLHEVAKAIDHMPKRGHNDHQHYDYVQAADVLAKIRGELYERKVIVLPSILPGSTQHFTETGGKGFATSADFLYTFYDTESGDSLALNWVGVGYDIGGEKGIAKAMTYALKTLLLNLFLIPTGDDPERDEVTEAASESRSKDAARPASPSIPMDRATGILELATTAGLATVETVEGKPVVTLMPVLKAKLAEVGVNSGKIAHLNVDQAEDVEKFLKAEVAA
jgi:hypothetical protein